DGGDEFAQFGFRHGGATGGRTAAVGAPDVEEDGGTGVGDDPRRRVVGDEKFQRMGGIILLHLLLLFPGGRWFAIEDDVPVVGGRGGVLDPEVARGDLAVGNAGVFADGLVVSPDAAEIEDAGGRAHVAFFF